MLELTPRPLVGDGLRNATQRAETSQLCWISAKLQSSLRSCRELRQKTRPDPFHIALSELVNSLLKKDIELIEAVK